VCLSRSKITNVKRQNARVKLCVFHQCYHSGVNHDLSTPRRRKNVAQIEIEIEVLVESRYVPVRRHRLVPNGNSATPHPLAQVQVSIPGVRLVPHSRSGKFREKGKQTTKGPIMPSSFRIVRREQVLPSASSPTPPTGALLNRRLITIDGDGFCNGTVTRRPRNGHESKTRSAADRVRLDFFQ
jgi:hypothetical protein